MTFKKAEALEKKSSANCSKTEIGPDGPAVLLLPSINRTQVVKFRVYHRLRMD